MIFYLIKTKADVTTNDVNYCITRDKRKLRHSADGVKVILAFVVEDDLARGQFKNDIWHDEIAIKKELKKSEWIPII